MTLDERARQAARELNAAVDDAELLLFQAGVPGRRTADRPAVRRYRGLAFAGAFAAILLFIGLTLGPGRLSAPDVADDVANDPGIPSIPDVEGDAAPPSDDAPTPTTPESPPESIVAADLTPPVITVNYPTEGAVFGDPQVVFEGTAEPGSTVYALTSPERTEAEIDEDGNWSILLLLANGTNPVRFVAVDDAGNESSEFAVSVTYTPETAPTTTITSPPKEDPPGDDAPAADAGPSPSAVAFSADRTYGESAESPPFDVYYGTAEPGSRIGVTSSYGEATTVAGEDGAWEVQVVFREAPTAEPFLVTVRDSVSGEARKFEFVARR